MPDEKALTPKQQQDIKHYEELHAKYLTQIDAYEREAGPWLERGKKILRIYKDSDNPGGKQKRYCILWSNVKTLKPAMYARDPKPEIERRYKGNDPVARAASEVLERCVSYTISCHGFGEVMKQCVEDRLLPGRGVPWVRYVPTMAEKDYKQKTQPTDLPQVPAQVGEQPGANPDPLANPPPAGASESMEVLYEQALIDYVFWEDFGHNIARFWEEVWLGWRRIFLDREELITEFGEEIGKVIPLDYTPKDIKDQHISDTLKKAEIYEMWDKRDGAIVFLNKSFKQVIKIAPDPLGLNGGFPFPKPLYATITNDSLIPIPDYVFYQTQAQDIENLTKRINSLQKALKLAGCYDSSAPALAQLLNSSFENKLIPVDTWAAFAEKGGLEGAVSWLPIKEVAEVVVALYEAREQAKQDLYEITGLADIIRGQSDPRETLGAQEIKGQFAVLRISDDQMDVQRLAADTIRLIAEIIAEHFHLSTIQQISGMDLPTEAEKQGLQVKIQQMQIAHKTKARAMMGQSTQQQPQPFEIPDEIAERMAQPTWEQVYELLRHDVVRDFKIEVETDSTIRIDEAAEKRDRNEFLAAASGFLQQAVTAAEAYPELGPLLGELLMFGIRAYKSGRQLEPAFEEALRKLNKRASRPQPDPEQQKIQAQMQLEQEKAKTQAHLEQQKASTQAQLEQRKQELQSQQTAQEKQMAIEQAALELQMQERIERYKAELTMQLEQIKAEMEVDKAIEIEKIKAQTTMQVEIMRAETGAATNRENLKAEGEARESERQESDERDSRRDQTLKTLKELMQELKSLGATAE